MTTLYLKNQLLTAVDSLESEANTAEKNRLKNIRAALSSAAIKDEDYLKVAMFIFVLYAEMQSLVSKSQQLKQLYLECDNKAVLQEQATSQHHPQRWR